MILGVVFILNQMGIIKFDNNYPVVIDDVSIEHMPKKICSLSPGMTENIKSINPNATFCAISDYCEFEDEKIDTNYAVDINNPSQTLPSGVVRCGSFQNPHIKKIISLKPDLIITYGSFTQSAAKQLSVLDSVVIQMSSSQNVSDYLLSYKTLCKIFLGNNNFEEFYLKYKTDFESSMNMLRNKISMLEENKRTYACVVSSLNALCTKDSLLSDLLSQSEMINISNNTTNFVMDTEEIINANPYYLIVDEKTTDEEILSSPFSELDAVKSGRIIKINYQLVESQYHDFYTIYDEIYSQIKEN